MGNLCRRKNMKVMVLCPHTDDGEIGVGGVTARLLEASHEVHYVVLSIPLPELHQECRQSINTFKTKNNSIHLHTYNFERRIFPEKRQEILQILYDLNKKIKPNLVFTPSTYDYHQDHETTTKEAMRAFRHTSILGYIIPYNCRILKEDVFISFSERHLLTKISALRHYASQRQAGRPATCSENIRCEAILRGLQCKRDYAEIFENIRVIL